MADESDEERIEIQDKSLPYRLRPHFLTVPEVALYGILTEMAGQRYVVLAKVALNRIFFIARPNENVHYFRKIFRKHVDFLLCDPQSLKPEIGVELVRRRPAVGTRPAARFVEDIFLTAGVPLVQIPPSDRYQIHDIVVLFQAAESKAKQVQGRLADLSADAVPNCPICGKMMVLRTHRVGSNEAQLYYGCIDSPTCAGTELLK